uniref:Uncharacterized protein n=1 Tax=Kalanchoe fedtschenkoi TaxID=63787 RepID=A0A7N0TI87_KALFE
MHLQGAYVLCRLFKKNDDTIEDSHHDEVQSVPTSPVSAASNLHIKSETEDFFTSGHINNLDPGRCVAGNFDKPAPLPLTSGEGSNMCCSHLDSSGTQPRDITETIMTMTAINSTSQSHLQGDLGSSFPITSSFNECEWPLQCGMGKQNDIFEYLDSVEIHDLRRDIDSHEKISPFQDETMDTDHVLKLTISRDESNFGRGLDPEVSLEQLFTELEGNCLSDTGHAIPAFSESAADPENTLFNSDDLEFDLKHYFEDVSFDGSLFYQLSNSSKEESGTSAIGDTGITLRASNQVNQPGTFDFQSQGTAARRILLQRRVGSVYHCNHAISHQLEAKSVVSQEVDLNNVKLISRTIAPRKWPLFASHGKSKRRPEEFHIRLAKKHKIWAAFAAVLFTVLIAFPGMKLLGKTHMLLDWP